MTRSQNAACFGSGPPDPVDEPHPPGWALAHGVAAALSSAGFVCTDPDNWRDVGWSFGVGRGDVRLLVTIAADASHLWRLQIAPLAPGIRAVVVRSSSLEPGALAAYEAAETLAPFLRSIFQTVSWALDADAADGGSQEGPIPPASTEPR